MPETARARIRDLIRDDPGIHVTDLARKANLSWNSTAYHLRILEERRDVTLEKRGRNRFAFPGGFEPHRRRWVTALRTRHAHEVLGVILANPGQDVPTLCRRLDLSAKVVRRRVAHLEAAGILERDGLWRPTYAVPGSVAAELQEFLGLHAMRLAPPSMASWEWDPRTGRSDVSAEGWRIIGVPPTPGRTYREFVATYIHPEDVASLAAVVERALEEGRSYEHTVRLRTPTGERHIRQRGWVSARGPDGKAARFSGTLEDVTEKASRRTIAEARRSATTWVGPSGNARPNAPPTTVRAPALPVGRTTPD